MSPLGLCMPRMGYPRAGVLMKVIFLANSACPDVNVRAKSKSPLGLARGGRFSVLSQLARWVYPRAIFFRTNLSSAQYPNQNMKSVLRMPIT